MNIMSVFRGDGLSSSSAKPAYIGELHLTKANSTESTASRRIYVGHDIVIGRDQSRCQWVLVDPYISAKHLRIYSIVYDNEDEHELEYLVYAEDLSRHGTFWNGSHVGKGNGGFLLSNDDKLRLSPNTTFRFVAPSSSAQPIHFDLKQEREMARFRNEYVLTDRLLGSGAFGRVFMAIEQNTRTQVACKLIDLRKLSQTTSKHFRKSEIPVKASQIDQTVQTGKIKQWADRQRGGSELEGKLEMYYREVDILSQLCHPNIVSIDKVFVTDNSIYIFQDLITAGDLFSYLESKNGRLLEVEAAVVIRQVLLALKFLHEQDVVHRDLKPENIMMTSLSAGCRVVLTDFGAARRVRPYRRMTSVVGSEQYAAPELSSLITKAGNGTRGYTKAVDMWSVGAITIVLLTGASAFSNPATGAYSPVLARNCNLDHLKTSREWRKMTSRPQDFVAKLLVLDEETRMTALQALEHTWFSNEIHKTDFEELYQRTVKDWRPRMAKTPVVEFFDSTFVKHLVPNSFAIQSKKRIRVEKAPVGPPYKPFPRNMHASLWPKKNGTARKMSEEVRTAIASLWTGGPRRIESRFKTTSTPITTVGNHISGQSRNSYEELASSVSPVVSEAKALPSGKLPLRLVSDLRTKLTSKIPVACEDASDLSHRTQLLAESAVINSSGKESYLINTLPTMTQKRPERGQNRLRGLSQSSNSAGTVYTIRKRPRSSIFDLDDSEESDISDMSDGESIKRVIKRRKIENMMHTIPEDQKNLVMAHSSRASIDFDFVEEYL